MKDFLLEIGTEELPANFANEAREQLKTLSEKWLKDNSLSFGELKTYSTPRRLVVFIKDLSEAQNDIEKELKGPSINVAFDAENKPTKALEGFLKSQNLSLEQIEKKDFKGNIFVFAKTIQKGIKSIELLPNFIQYLISSISVTRGMRWADYNLKFSRPIQWILALFGNEIMNFELESIKSSNFTMGHRFLSSGKIEISSADEYFSKLLENKVLLDNEKRKANIVEQLNKIAESVNASVIVNESLLNEVNQLVEYPFAIMGSFDERYLELPEVVNVTVMKSHQRYFPLFDKNNKLLPNFITISNMNLNENNIRTGNETVLRARLEDAMFFYKEDLKEPFENKIEKLKRVTYFEEIGSIYDKTKRISKIAQKLNSLYNLDEKEVLRASSLCKADLVTNLVKEFTELQGEIGYYYSLKTNESENIAYAIKEQYLPTGNNDNAPSQPLSQIINFSDKLDNLVSCFALGKIPTGSKDPFSLRRQCLGIIRTCDKYKIGLNFNEMINNSYDILIEQKKLTSNKEETLDKIREFFSQRFKNELLDRGFKHDLVDSILDTHYYLSDLYATQEKLRVLANWEKEEASKNVSMAFARVIRIAKEKTNNEIDINLFEKEEEKNLYNAFRLVKPDFEHHFNKKDFHSCLIILQNLVSPINNFFDNVMIMVEDKNIKNNRLALLNEVKEMSLKIANMDKIIL